MAHSRPIGSSGFHARLASQASKRAKSASRCADATSGSSGGGDSPLSTHGDLGGSVEGALPSGVGRLPCCPPPVGAWRASSGGISRSCFCASHPHVAHRKRSAELWLLISASSLVMNCLHAQPWVQHVPLTSPSMSVDRRRDMRTPLDSPATDSSRAGIGVVVHWSHGLTAHTSPSVLVVASGPKPTTQTRTVCSALRPRRSSASLRLELYVLVPGARAAPLLEGSDGSSSARIRTSQRAHPLGSGGKLTLAASEYMCATAGGAIVGQALVESTGI